MHTHTEHTLGNGDTTQQPARDSKAELAATAPAAAAASVASAAAAAVLLLVRLLLHGPRCLADHTLAQQTVFRRVVYGTLAGANNERHRKIGRSSSSSSSSSSNNSSSSDGGGGGDEGGGGGTPAAAGAVAGQAKIYV